MPFYARTPDDSSPPPVLVSRADLARTSPDIPRCSFYYTPLPKPDAVFNSQPLWRQERAEELVAIVRAANEQLSFSYEAEATDPDAEPQA